LAALASAVKSLPGRTLVEFGKDIGKSGSQLSEYACTMEYYQTADVDMNYRIETLKHRLCYTLFRDAKKLGDVSKSVNFLEMAHDNNWSVDKARATLADMQAGKPVLETWIQWDSRDLDGLSWGMLFEHIKEQVYELQDAGYGVFVKVLGVGERVTV
jgi:hypothetical protein